MKKLLRYFVYARILTRFIREIRTVLKNRR
jgi:hypothetical protein